MFQFQNSFNQRKVFRGRGILNKFIDLIPFEIHIPGYQFCGPGTKLKERLDRGDKGVNPLDAACRVHDIAYSKNKDLLKRSQADKLLTERAWERVLAKDSTIGEKSSAYFVTNVMKAKTKLGMGLNKKKKCDKNLFMKTVKTASNILKKEKPKNVKNALKIARKIIQNSFKGKKASVVIPRIINVPKTGGFLPLIPILSALGALGGLASGGSAIAKVVNEAKNAKHQLEENKRHNKTMETIALGEGLYLKPYRRGYGLIYKNSKN